MEYIFYEIKCNDSNITEFYIGSTTNFTRRKCEHKSTCNNVANKGYNLKIYSIIRENGGWINWTMSPIDKQVFETKIDARIYENKLMQELNTTLNTYNAYVDKKEYKKEYCENHKEHIKEYYQKRKESIKEYQKEYHKTNKEYIKERKKEYYQKRKESIKEYYQKNKANITIINDTQENSQTTY